MVRRLVGAVNVAATRLALLALQVVNDLIEVIVELRRKAMASVSNLLRDWISHPFPPGSRVESK